MMVLAMVPTTSSRSGSARAAWQTLNQDGVFLLRHRGVADTILDSPYCYFA